MGVEKANESAKLKLRKYFTFLKLFPLTKVGGFAISKKYNYTYMAYRKTESVTSLAVFSNLS